MKAGNFDMVFNICWGTPYDPQSSLAAMRQRVYGDYAAQLGLEDKAEIDEAIMVYNDDDVETVLRAIAKASENKPFANRSDIKTNLDPDVEDGIIKQLYSRDVIDQKEKYQDEISHKEKYRFLKIKVRLYKEWLLKH